MTRRKHILHAARVASQVLHEAKVRERVFQSGYTRVDPVRLAEEAGIAVLARPLNQLLGAFLREGAPGILLNIQRPVGLLHMTCAHELGHFHLGHKTTADVMIEYREDASIFELEADQFAYSLTTPSWLLAHLLKTRRWADRSLTSPKTIYQLSLRLGISYLATVWSLHRHNYLSRSVAQHLASVPPRQLKRLIALGLGEIEADSDIWLLSPQDRDAVLEPRPNDRFIVETPNHHAAGYLWTLDDAVSVGYSMKPLALEAVDVTEDAIVGPIGKFSRYLLEPRTQATVMSADPQPVLMRETQPWRGQQPGDADFSVQTQFEHIRPGLTGAGRGQRVKEALQLWQ